MTIQRRSSAELTLRSRLVVAHMGGLTGHWGKMYIPQSLEVTCGHLQYWPESQRAIAVVINSLAISPVICMELTNDPQTQKE